MGTYNTILTAARENGLSFTLQRQPLPDWCRSRNTTIHPKELFTGRPKTYDGGTPLEVNTPPKLAIVDLSRETYLFKGTDYSNRFLKAVMGAVIVALHPQGTMALVVSRP